MKKILLSLMLIGAFTSGKAQLVLNEIYPDPSIPPNEEYIELFNTGSGSIDIGCYTLVTYSPGSPSTIWVYDLPTYSVGAFGFVVFGSAVPIDHQGGSYGPAANAFSWNDGVSLKKYTISGATLTLAAGNTTTDLIPITGGNSTTLNIMVFDQTGNLVTGFFANNSHQIPTEVANLGNQPGIGACGTTLQFGDAATNAEVFDLNQAPGNDNGYRRQNNGFCGTWEKAEPANTYSPGESNGTGAEDQSLVQVAAIPRCYTRADGTNHNGITTWEISITVTQANLLTAFYTIYEDISENGGDIPDAGDVPPLVPSTAITSTSPVTFKVEATAWRDIYIQVITNSNCITRLVHLSSGCAPLPVTLKSFNAVRGGSNVNLTWETSIEDNNTGFEVQKFLGGAGGWQNIGFVSTQAINGSSSVPLNYQFTDFNNTTKGITQYRLKQVDKGNRSTYSFIRSVRGDGQKGKTIVYPNPSSNGKVNIIFEDVNSIRDISVSDMSGRVIKQMRGVTNNNITIDNLNAGFYTVRIVNNETGEQTIEKFVVNKR